MTFHVDPLHDWTEHEAMVFALGNFVKPLFFTEKADQLVADVSELSGNCAALFSVNKLLDVLIDGWQLVIVLVCVTGVVNDAKQDELSGESFIKPSDPSHIFHVKVNAKLFALYESFGIALELLSSGLSVDEVNKGMSSDKKKRLFPQIMSEYLAVHPKADSVPFTWIKSHLAEKYQIECRSISNFFVGILDEYELVSGNRNRAVKCN